MNWNADTLREFCTHLYGGWGPKEREKFGDTIGARASSVEMWMRKPSGPVIKSLDTLAELEGFVPTGGTEEKESS